MSRSKSSALTEAEDIWSKLQRAPLTKVSDTVNDGVVDSGVSNTSIVFVGDLNSGKSTLIQTFLKPTTVKDTKPTVALEYNFARRTTNGVKCVANLWEIGGDLIEPKLMEIGLTLRNLSVAAVIISCDLSKPHNILNSLLRSISAVKETASKRVAELQATNVLQLNEMRDKLAAPYKGNPDEGRVRPLDVPVCIVANKHDLFKSLPSADRRAIIQVLRFVAHFFGAHLITTSSADATQRDTFRTLVSNLAFGSAVKPMYETNVDKMVYITRGSDSFQKIFLEHSSSTGDGDVVRSRVSVVCSTIVMKRNGLIFLFLSCAHTGISGYGGRYGELYHAQGSHQGLLEQVCLLIQMNYCVVQLFPLKVKIQRGKKTDWNLHPVSVTICSTLRFFRRLSVYMQSLFGEADPLPNSSLSAPGAMKGEGTNVMLILTHTNTKSLRIFLNVIHFL